MITKKYTRLSRAAPSVLEYFVGFPLDPYLYNFDFWGPWVAGNHWLRAWIFCVRGFHSKLRALTWNWWWCDLFRYQFETSFFNWLLTLKFIETLPKGLKDVFGRPETCILMAKPTRHKNIFISPRNLIRNLKNQSGKWKSTNGPCWMHYWGTQQELLVTELCCNIQTDFSSSG